MGKGANNSGDTHERWEEMATYIGDYVGGCVKFACDALEHMGFTDVYQTLFPDFVSSFEGDVPVSVGVIALPPERWDITLDEMDELIDDNVRRQGEAFCMFRALAHEDAPLERQRFDVMGVCLNLENPGVRLRHIKGVLNP